MQTETLDRAAFVRVWEALISRILQDSRFRDRLYGDTRSALVEVGLPLPVGAVVALEETPAGRGPEMDRQLQRYVEGLASGFFLFAVP
ncbi:hypothetical protein ABLE68_10540 [Nocardioides sp. CN2-186]|uniref:hypothetical protein n=1 Tax=Nocardioides tweenelious TaxID=3156607 RepID=UPI0032B41BE2